MAFVALASFATNTFAQQKRIYIALDDHTDYMWSANEADYRQVFLDSLDYYLNLADTTASNPPQYQSRFNTDGTFWIWTYEKNKTAVQFDRLIGRIRSGHIGVPMNALVSTYGGQPAEAVLRGMYYAGSLERRYGLSLPLVESMENQTLPYGLGALWAGSGARYSWRGVCNCYTHVNASDLFNRGHEIYRWVGPDGSSIIMKWNSLIGDNQSIGGYAEARSPATVINLVDTSSTFRSKYPYNVIGAFGKGWDDLKTLTSEFVTTAQAQSNSARQIIVSNEVDFFQDFEASFGASLPSESLGYGNEWDVTSASMSEVTASVRRAVEKLRAAEALSTLVALKNPAFLSGRAPARDLAFMDLGLYWEHDWDGIGVISKSQRAAWQRKIAREITSYVDGLQADAAAALGAMIPSSSANPRFYVFNALSWPRTEAADLPYAGPGPVHVVDVSSGLDVPSQIVTVDGQQRLRILASGVPSVGYKVYEVQPGAGSGFANAAVVSGSTIENGAYRVTVAANGAITSLVDKRLGNREFVRTIGSRTANDLGAGTGTLSVENAGPVSVTLRANASGPLAHETRITLSAADRVEIRNDINQNFSSVQTWRYGFNIDAPVTRHEEVGAVVKAAYASNGGVYSRTGSRYDWLTLNHFVDLTAGAGNAGITLSSADLSFMRLGASSGATLDTSTPQVSVLAGGQVDGSSIGIVAQDGDTHFMQRFALQTHAAYDTLAAMRFALQHQNPLAVGTVSNGSDYPADSYSLLSIGTPDTLLWALKPAEDGIDSGVILRMWNLGTDADFVVSTQIPLGGAEQTTHIETPLEPATVSGNALFASAKSQQLVTYRLLTTPTPSLSVAPATLNLFATVGGANPAPAFLSVSNSGTGTLSVTAASDAAWLSVTPSSGTAPTSFEVRASVAGLTAQTYTGHVILTSAGASGSPKFVTVNLTVSAQTTPILSVSPSTLSFSATVGGANPATASLSVSNTGNGTLSFTAASDAAWLAVNPSAGSAPTNLQVSPSIAGLTAGTYTGHVTITSAGASGSPKVVTVNLTVNAPNPILSVSPSTLSFSATAGGANPAAASLSVSNTGNGALSFSAASDAAWLAVNPSSGSAPASLQVSASIAGLTAGTYTGHVTISAAASGSPRVTLVTLTVAASQGGGGTTVLLGEQTVKTNQDKVTGGVAEAFRTTALASGSLGSITVYVDPASTATTLTVGLYSNSGTHPGGLLTQGSLSSPVAGAWNTVLVPNASVVSGAAYWITVLGPVGSGTLRFRNNASGGASETSAQTTLATLPATWATGTVYSNTALSAYGSSISGPILAVTPAAITFTATAGGAAPAPASLSVSNSGTGTLSFTASSDAAWLTVNPSSGSAPASLQVSVSTTGLSAGTYTGYVTTTSSVATGSPKVVPVTLTVQPPAPALSAVAVSPATVVGGTSASGTVTLSAPATAASVVTLTSNSSAAVVPASVTVPVGQTGASFTISTVSVSANTSVTIGAAYNAMNRSATLTVQPPAPALSAVAVNPATVVGGTSSSGTVTLSAPATAASVVTLTSNSSAAVVPASVTVPVGQTSASFTISTVSVSANTSVTIGAAYNAVNRSATLTVQPPAPALSAVAVSPATVVGGTSTSGTVTLTAPATAASVVTLTSNSSAAVVPASVTVAAGQTSASFTITTVSVSASTTATIGAAYNSVNRNTTLTVQAAAACSGPTPLVLLGSQTVQPSTDSVMPGRAEAFAATSTMCGSAVALNIYVNSGSTATSIVAGIYANAAGHPGALLGKGTLASPVAGAWNRISLPAVTLENATSYWIAVLGPGGTLQFRNQHNGPCRSETSAQSNLTTLPASWTSGTGYSDCPLSGYATSQ